jgi:hypothetical protein
MHTVIFFLEKRMCEPVGGKLHIIDLQKAGM